MRRGQIISERYQIIRLLGSGGMANVYLAEDLILNREVAIKFLRLDLDDQTDAAKRFEREAKSVSELNHPNIVSIYDVGTGSSGDFIVMEYVRGIDLKQYIRQNQPMPLETFQSLFLQMLAGVQCAHEHHITHRDLKPQNIMITENGQVKIMDFGIAIVSTQTSLTQTSAIIGSVHYLSPEQARGSFATPRSDIYSLGIVAFEMLTGQVPFDGESPVGVAVKHFQKPLPDLADFRSDIPPTIQNMIYKATAKDREARYMSCEAMAYDLESALDQNRLAETIVRTPLSSKETMVINKPLTAEHQWTFDDVAEENKHLAQNGPQEEVPRHRKLLPRKRWLFGIAGGSIGILLLIFFLLFRFTQLGGIRIPDVSGATQDEAIAELQQANLKIGEINKEPSDTIKPDLIVRTVPGRHTRVKKNSKVDLFTSTGPKSRRIPDVTGKSFKEAKKIFSQLGFEVVKKDQFSAEMDKDHVLAQSLKAGENRKPKPGEKVTLTVSKGPETFTMEDLTGRSRQEVLDYAKKVRIQVNFHEQYAENQDPDQVLSQSIAPGEKFEEGQQMDVTLSKGQETERFSYTVSLTYQGTGEETEGNEEDPIERLRELLGWLGWRSQPVYAESQAGDQIEVYIEDLNHAYDQVADQFTIQADRDYTMHFETRVGEEARFKIVQNGKIVMENRVKAGD